MGLLVMRDKSVRILSKKDYCELLLKIKDTHIVKEEKRGDKTLVCILPISCAKEFVFRDMPHFINYNNSSCFMVENN